MSRQVHETIPSAVMPQAAVSHAAEYGAEAGGILLVAAVGYVAARGFIRSKMNNLGSKVRDEFHMPPASTYDEPVPVHELGEDSLRTNRRNARYIQAFFGVSSGDPEADQQYIDEVSRLSRINTPENLPHFVRDEVPKIIHRIRHATKVEPGSPISLFNTRRKDQPSGLSLAVALARVGFSTHKVKAQYNENVDFDEASETMTTYAELKGKDSIRINFAFDGVDTKVSFVRQDLSEPIYQPEAYEPPRAEKDVKRARPHGHDIMGVGNNGVSTGRKRGVMPPGGSTGSGY